MTAAAHQEAAGSRPRRAQVCGRPGAQSSMSNQGPGELAARHVSDFNHVLQHSSCDAPHQQRTNMYTGLCLVSLVSRASGAGLRDNSTRQRQLSIRSKRQRGVGIHVRRCGRIGRTWGTRQGRASVASIALAVSHRQHGVMAGCIAASQLVLQHKCCGAAHVHMCVHDSHVRTSV